MFFQSEVKCFEILSFKDKLKSEYLKLFSNGWSVEIIYLVKIFLEIKLFGKLFGIWWCCASLLIVK